MLLLNNYADGEKLLQCEALSMRCESGSKRAGWSGCDTKQPGYWPSRRELRTDYTCHGYAVWPVVVAWRRVLVLVVVRRVVLGLWRPWP